VAGTLTANGTGNVTVNNVTAGNLNMNGGNSTLGGHKNTVSGAAVINAVGNATVNDLYAGSLSSKAANVNVTNASVVGATTLQGSTSVYTCNVTSGSTSISGGSINSCFNPRTIYGANPGEIAAMMAAANGHWIGSSDRRYDSTLPQLDKILTIRQDLTQRKDPVTIGHEAVDVRGPDASQGNLAPALVSVTVETDGLFPFGKSNLNDIPNASFAKLNSALLEIRSGFSKLDLVEIVGHTDRIGSGKANMALSNARANAVKAFFVQNGVNPSLIKIRAVGESQPVVNCAPGKGSATIACLAPNRRVEVIVTGRKRR
jgi:outer membrane protein OmpA-like peptidoglycan-associated protein